MVFPGGGPECRHPSQLYEAGLEGGLLFIVLWLIGRQPTPPGTVCWGFITGYGLCRVVVEFFREPDFHLGFILGPFSMGQLLSAPMILIGAFMLAWGYRQAEWPERPPCSRTTHVTSGAWRAGGLTCSRVAYTGLIVPGLGGRSAGDPLLFRMQRVITRALR